MSIADTTTFPKQCPIWTSNSTHHPQHLISHLLDGPASLLVIILGLIGNIYSIRVVFKSTINTTTIISLVALACWDIINLLTAFFHHSFFSLFTSMDEVIGSHVFVLWFRSNIPYNPLVAQALLNGLLACAYMASTWMLIYVTAQRFMVISRPLSFLSHSSLSVKKVPRSSAIRSVLRQIKIPCALSVVSALISFPCSFEWSFEVCIGQDSKEIEMVNPTSLMTNKSYIILYKTIILPLLQTFGPIVIISFLTIQTLKKMKRSMDRRALILIEQGKGSIFFSDRDKTKSLQLISSLLLSKFVILRCFPTVLEIFKLIQGNNVSGLTKFADLLIILNSATNSFVFVVVKAAFETRRLRKARERQRLFVAKTAEEIFRISRFLASDKTLLVPKNNNEDKQSLSVTTNSDETSS